MSVFEHSRFKIYNKGQHPYNHTPQEFVYTNPRLTSPLITNMGDTLDYIIAVLYPNWKATVADVAALNAYPAPQANDYILVNDDGDGKSAGYVYSVIDGVSQWIKRYDVDWSFEGILAETITRTQYMYVQKYGFTDHDAAGTPIVGLYAGQTIFGGDLAGQNLTFNANASDATGFVQTDNIFRPTSDNALTLGTAALRWSTIFGTTLVAGTLTATSGSITDSSGAIDFGNENLSTTGTLASGVLTATGNSFVVGSLTVGATGDLSLNTGSIVSASGTISFTANDLITSGAITGGSGVFGALGDITIVSGSITSASGAITFGNENLSTTGTLSSGVFTATQVNVDDLRLDNNLISVVTANVNLNLQANGTGVIGLLSNASTLNLVATGLVSATVSGQFANLLLSGNTLSSTNANGNIILSPNGTGEIQFSSKLAPTADNTKDVGDATHRVRTLFLGTSLSDGTTVISSATLQSFRDANVGVNPGDVLFWSGTEWLPSAPDTEITHGSLSGLGADDHAQYLLLAGRVGGQSVIGGTAASNNLTLESTSNAAKGSIFSKDNLSPFTNATFAAGWQGTDLGDATHFYRDLYMKGEARNLRAENFTFAGLPGASANNVGRLAWATDQDKLYADVGGTWEAITVSKWVSDTVWNGTDVTKTVTVSSVVTDARNVVWSLLDNANDFVQIFADITAISATQVTITVNVALAANSYRLVGIE